MCSEVGWGECALCEQGVGGGVCIPWCVSGGVGGGGRLYKCHFENEGI